MKKVKLVLAVLFVFGFLVGVNQASADPLLFDRGLPTVNLNNVAGANRSNVGWAFTQAKPEDYWLVGDDFKLGGQSHVDTIRVWVTSTQVPLTGEGISLWLGPQGGSIVHLSAPLSVTSVTYLGGASYETSTPSTYRQIYQLDFTLDTILSAGTYQFFLDGPIMTFLHSSNASLSGSPQEEADNLLLAARVLNGNMLMDDVNFGSWDSNAANVWDKSSDGNVQVFGSAVPEPATFFLFGGGLVALAAYRKRSKKA